MNHPAETELAALLVGQLSEAAAESVAAHIDRCPACRAAVERLTAVPEELRAQVLVSSRTKTTGPQLVPQVPGYDDLRELGRGGCGVVYRARETAGDRVVAVKVLRAGVFATAAERTWFRAEAEAAARLKHPNIVEVYAVGGTEATPYYAMEYAFGGSLAGRLDGTPLPPATAARVVRDIASAVQFAHAAGVVHRDLKPGNILLDDGDDPLACPKVGDFGMAKTSELSAFPTPTHAVVGTPSYMAPEQAFGRSSQVGPTADVYSLGAVLYELLTGRPPFRGETPYETLLQVRSLPVVWPRQLRPDTPRSLEAVCLKCLEKRPKERYATAAALSDDLTRFLAGGRVTARHPGPVRRVARWAKGNPSAARFTAVLAVVVVAAFAGLSSLWLHAQEQKAVAQHRADEANKARIETRKALVDYAGIVSRLFRNLDSVTPAEKATLLRTIESAVPVLAAPTGDPDEEHAAAFALLQLADGLAAVQGYEAAVAPCRTGHAVLERLAAEHPARDRFVFDHSQACSQLAGTLAQVGQLGEYETLTRRAVVSAEAVLARRPGNVGVLGALATYRMKLATHFVGNGEWEEAGRLLDASEADGRALIAADPKNPIRHIHYDATATRRAYLRFARDGTADAFLAHARFHLDAFARSRHLHAAPDWCPVLLQMTLNAGAVEALDRTGRRAEADALLADSIRAVTDLAALRPDDRSVETAKASLLYHDGCRGWESDRKRSSEQFKQAVRIAEASLADPDGVTATLRLRALLAVVLACCPDPAIRNPKRAVEVARSAATDPSLRECLGLALFEAGELAGAKKELTESVRWYAANHRTTVMIRGRAYLARTLWGLGEREDARATLQRLEDDLGRNAGWDISQLGDRATAWRLVERSEPPEVIATPKR